MRRQTAIGRNAGNVHSGDAVEFGTAILHRPVVDDLIIIPAMTDAVPGFAPVRGVLTISGRYWEGGCLRILSFFLEPEAGTGVS